MFTGIVSAIGEISGIDKLQDDVRLRVNTGSLGLDDVHTGDSIAVNGVCLTVLEKHENEFSADVSVETLSCSTFADLAPGSRVNLEKAMQLSDRLSGHIVSGHVDGIGQISGIQEDARCFRIIIKLPVSLARYVCKKGSICIDGVSLTVNEVTKDSCSVNIIPHTMEQTIIAGYQVNTRVNIEVDLVARYLERLTLPQC